jgi:hypothetical protein
MTKKIFHKYDAWPPENATIRVPRISEAEAQKIIGACALLTNATRWVPSASTRFANTAIVQLENFIT